MATPTPSAYAVPVALLVTGIGLPTSFQVQYQAVAQDGINTPAQFSGCFVYDATQTPATNLATFKASVASLAACFGFTVSTSNILVFTAVN